MTTGMMAGMMKSNETGQELPSHNSHNSHDLYDLHIGGIAPFSTIDFPLVSTSLVVFCQGCIWRCPYCQNKTLQPLQGQLIPWTDVLVKIKARIGFLDGIVFSGGEPLIQIDALKEAVNQVKQLGFKIGLHTSGCLPNNLQEILPLLDWVGLDIKAPFDQYDRITKVANSGEQSLESLRSLLSSKVPFECRTTVDPLILNQEDILKIAQTLHKQGAQVYALQECRDDNRLAKNSDCFDPRFLEQIRPLFPKFIVRRATD